nr:uncharacterized protein LOC128688223 [Cherax quadricarinatus]
MRSQSVRGSHTVSHSLHSTPYYTLHPGMYKIPAMHSSRPGTYGSGPAQVEGMNQQLGGMNLGPSAAPPQDMQQNMVPQVEIPQEQDVGGRSWKVFQTVVNFQQLFLELFGRCIWRFVDCHND